MNKFWLKIINLLLVAGLILGYNGVLEHRIQAENIDRLQAELETEKMREKQYYEKENTSDEQLSENNNAQEQETSIFRDGKYEGDAKGFGGLITVQINVVSDTITDITILSAPKEDRAYLETASVIVNDILEKQTTQVDTVSGATFSSRGIRNAVSNALKKAENK